ncbi:MAG: PAS domain-containing protein, partial [Desulfuromonadaceae bacterium]|nr:PAS domain-containing protein [Desulfuromonadaceae bacterium]
MVQDVQKSSRREIVRIVAVYSIFGGLWIYLSDTFLGMVISDPVVISRLSMYKGLLFIVLTAALLYVLIARYIKQINAHLIELEQAQETLSRQKSLLDIVVDGTDDAVYIKDAVGRYLFINSAGARMTNKAVEEIIGRDDTELFPPDEARTVMAQDQWVLLQESLQTYEECVTTCAGKRYFLSTKGPVRGVDGTITGLFGIARDISERKQTGEALEKSEELFRSFVENFNDILFVLTPAGDFSYVSPQWKDAFGYDLSETIGQPFLPFVHPEDISGCLTFLQEVIESGNKQSGIEYRVLCKDGTYLWYRANGSLLKDPVTGSVSFIGIGRDISDIKR